MPTLTPVRVIPAKPHKIGKIPETLGSLLAAMSVREAFIGQTQPDTQEYWSCQRDLAELERRWAEAEKVWAAHVGKEDKK
jgi:hypothetical protein